VNLREKLEHLRLVEGQLRGLGRPLTKAEIARLMVREIGEGVSQSYLSQLESGARVHLSATSRDLLARFFKVHPGYLVSDPPGYSTTSSAVSPPTLREWLEARAEAERDDPLLARALDRLAREPDPRRWLLFLDDMLDLPEPRRDTLARVVAGNGHEA
jgi:transcriptional regulator with XRE-family HTH domain